MVDTLPLYSAQNISSPKFHRLLRRVSDVEAAVSTETTVTRLPKAPRSYSNDQHPISIDPQAMRCMICG
jgi:hypothetical protein